MSNKKQYRAFGVYGLYIKSRKILVINKNTGPYINRYDLPGEASEAKATTIVVENLLESWKVKENGWRGFLTRLKRPLTVISLNNIRNFVTSYFNKACFDCKS